LPAPTDTPSDSIAFPAAILARGGAALGGIIKFLAASAPGVQARVAGKPAISDHFARRLDKVPLELG